ncbi:MAG TPA: glycosyltransferase family 39 protein [Fimbriimonadaceae bacterium]|nr:glycosyltransferase family 39 protein [Fimbriimonadaceae bacterium]
MKGKAPLLLAALLAALHAILAIVYAGETPYRTAGVLLSYGHFPAPDIGAPDERQHANYIQTLLDGKGFPVFKPGGADVAEHYEDHQPPLYYLAAAGFAKLVGVSDVADPGAYKIRWLNAIFGAGTILGIFFLGLWGLGRADAALGAAAIAAALPMNCALSGAISNDPLLFMVCTWALAICGLGIRQGWNMKLAVLAGVLVGLGILTKTTAVGLLPILLLAILLPQKKRPTWGMAGAAAASLVLLTAPWLVRNASLYGDPLALKAFNSAFTQSRQKADSIAQIQAENPEGGNFEMIYWRDWVGWWTARSFFGTFGYMDIWMNETGSPYQGRTPAPNVAYRVFLAISLLLFLAWIASFFQGDWKDARAVQVLNATFLAIVVLLFIRFNLQYFQAQGRYLYPAIGPIALALSIGCFVLLKDRGKIAVAVFAVGLLLFNVFAIAKLPEEFQRRATTTSPSGELFHRASQAYDRWA